MVHVEGRKERGFRFKNVVFFLVLLSFYSLITSHHVGISIFMCEIRREIKVGLKK